VKVRDLGSDIQLPKANVTCGLYKNPASNEVALPIPNELENKFVYLKENPLRNMN